MSKRIRYALIGALAYALIWVVAQAQQPTDKSGAYTYNGSDWVPATTSSASNPLGYVPPAIAMYCFNGTNWVPADSSCFGGGSGLSALTQDVLASGTGSVPATVVGINDTLLSGLSTGLLKNTTGTGVPSIAIPGVDYALPSTSPSGYAPNQTLAGCGVEYVTGLTYVVGACQYTINGVTYNSPQATLTLTGDPSNDVIDVILVDNTGAASFIEGTPGVNPQQPTIDPSTQLELTFVYIPAAATTPSNVTLVNIFDEGTEWTPTYSAHFALSTTNPFRGTHDVEATTAVLGNSVHFTDPSSGTVQLQNYNNLIFYIRSKAAWPTGASGATAARSLAVFWGNGATQHGAQVILRDGQFGFSSSNTTSYQQISIPLSLFGAAGIALNRLTFQIAGVAGSSSIGFYLDAVSLQGGNNTVVLPTTLMNFKGTWNATAAYNANDTVVSSGIGYVALAANTNDAVTDTTTWAALSGGGTSVTWPTSNDLVVSNGTNSPAGLAPVNGDCVVGSGGIWTAGSCASSSPYTNVSGSGSQTTVSALNTLCGSGTLYATTPLSIATGGTLTCGGYQFSKSGLWTIASGQTVTFGAPITETDGPSQHFAGSGTVVLASQNDRPEWWGAVGDCGGTYGVTCTTNNATAMQAALTALPSGNMILRCLGYGIGSGLSITKSNVGIIGECQGYSFQGAPASYIVNTSATATTLSVSGTSGTLINWNTFKSFSLLRSQAPTSGAIGFSATFVGGLTVDHVQSNDSIQNFYLEETPSYGVGGLTNTSAGWGYNGFSSTGTLYCHYLDGTSFPFDSLRIRHAACSDNDHTNTASNGLYVTAGGTGAISDLMVDGYETGYVGTGIYVNGGNQGSPYTNTDVHLLNSILDNCLVACFSINNVVSGAITGEYPSGVEISGGWTAAPLGQYNVYINSSIGVRVQGLDIVFPATVAGIYVTGSGEISIINNHCLAGAPSVGNTVPCIVLNNTSRSSVTGNILYGSHPNSGTSALLALTGSPRNSLSGNTISGYVQYGITFDATSTNNSSVETNMIDPSLMTGAYQDLTGGSTNHLATGLSGMTVGQVPIAATVSTVTSSKALSGSGAGITTGPTSATSGDIATFSGTTGQIQDSSTLLSSLAPTVSPAFTGTPTAPTASGGTNTTQLATTAFVQAAIAAAGTGSGIVTYSGPSLTFSGTLYFPIGGGGLSSSVESNVDIDSPAATTIQSMTVQMSAAPGVGNSITYTWRKNSADTPLTCTISGSSSTSCSDTTHSFTTAALDLLDIKVVTTGTVIGTPTVVMAAQVGISSTTSTAFSAISTGTNTIATMTCGTGCAIGTSGTGTNASTSVGGVTVTGTPSAGQVLTATSASAANWQAGGGGGFPFTFIQQDTFATTVTATSMTYTFPQALQSSGATAFIIVGIGQDASLTYPSGWTVDFTVNGGSNQKLTLLHVASAGQTSATFTSGAANGMGLIFFEVSGSHTYDTSSASGSSSNLLTITLPSITPSSGAVVFGVGTDLSNSSVQPTIPPAIDPNWKAVATFVNGSGVSPRPVFGYMSTVGAAGSAVTPPILHLNAFYTPYASAPGTAWATFSIK